MIDEADVLREFLHGDLTFRGAIVCLQKMGYHPKEAEQVVTKWAEQCRARWTATSTNRWGATDDPRSSTALHAGPCGNLRG